jgi:hypothetical protein
VRLSTLQHRRPSILLTVGGCLAVYAVCAVGFHSFVEPSLAKNQPPPAPVLQYSPEALAARANAVASSSVAASRPASTTVAAAPVTAPTASKAAQRAAAKAAAKVAPSPGRGTDSGPGACADPGRGTGPGSNRGGGTGAGGDPAGTDCRPGGGSSALSGTRSDRGRHGKAPRRGAEEAGPQARGTATQAAAGLL